MISAPVKNLSSLSVAMIVLSGSSLVLAGCNGLSPTAPVTVPGVALHGTLHGGQQPISNATIQLYAAGSTGYGSAYTYSPGTSLLGTHVVTTDANGGFSITGDYTCPSLTTEVYLVGTGGNPGPTAPTNSNIALMAALGPCGNLSSSTNVQINEITTVASVWALSPFMTGVANIGTSSGNAQGLTNAFATVNKLVNIGTGSVSGPALPTGATVPVAKINTLADILASCINSAGLTSMSDTTSSCGMLFTAATVNSVEPTDTITAAMNLAQHPNQGTTLANNVNAQSQFQPTLVSAPSDFSLVITYTGGGLSTPKGIAADASGNVWVANSGANSVTKFDALGITTTDATGYLSGNSGYTVGSLSAPVALAIDTSGNAWVANGNNTVTEIAAGGSPGTLFSGGSLSSPSGVAIDASSNVWVANSGNGSITEITPGPTPTYANYTGSGIAAPTAIAINPK
jgi:streptogramin lyase